MPDLDSNQDKQYQKLSYYHYTIRQLNTMHFICTRGVKIALQKKTTKCNLSLAISCLLLLRC